MCLSQPIGTRYGHPTHLGVHSGGKTHELSELGTRAKIWDVSETLHNSKGFASVIYDLVGKKTRKIRIWLTRIDGGRAVDD
jgi:hypothetical protein